LALVTNDYQSLPIVYIQGLECYDMSTQTSDVYSMYKQNVQKYFENISKITPQYFQYITQLQEECMKTCEKTITASVSMQQEFAKKSGVSTDIPEAAKTAITDINKQVVQASTINNQLVKTTVDATVQNIRTFSDNINAFATLNTNIIQSWITPFTLKN